jgi:hypothetical protein
MPVLKFPRGAERPAEEKPRSEPDRGNPAVRDRRGACGNMGVMGAGLRPGGKPSDVPPYPYMLRAPHFYPDRVAGEPHARFGGRGWRALFPTPI